MKFLFIVLNFFSIYDLPSDILVPSWFDPSIHYEKVNIIEYDGITIYAENLENNNEYLVFDIEIVNNTKLPLIVDPANVKLITSDNKFPEHGTTQENQEFESGLRSYSLLTEKEVAEDLIEKMENKKKTGTFLGILTTGLVIFDAAMDIKDFKDPEWSSGKQLGSDIRNLLTMAGITATDAIRQQHVMKGRKSLEDLHFLENEIYRFGSIPDGGYTRGKMFFPDDGSKYFRMIFIINDIEYVLDFRLADSADLSALYN